MTALTHCDGPGCEVTTTDGPGTIRRLLDGWMRLDSDHGNARHFHDLACLAAWASAHTSPAADPGTTAREGTTKENDR